MKLAALYNVFDGEELLKASIESIRKDVDEVIVVWQNVSYSGEQHPNPELRDYLHFLQEKNYVDQLIYFIPSSQPAQLNELAKRNIALQKAMDLDCDYCLPMDVDEFYDNGALAFAKQDCDKNKLSAFCGLDTYYKYSNVILTPPENYYVPMLYELNMNSRFGAYPGMVPPIRVDPARWMPNINHVTLYKSDCVLMRHLSYVRKDIALKLRCSSSYKSFAPELHSLIKDYNEFEPVGTSRIHMPFQREYEYKILDTCPPGTEQFQFTQK